jgi:plastocyanin
MSIKLALALLSFALLTAGCGDDGGDSGSGGSSGSGGASGAGGGGASGAAGTAGGPGIQACPAAFAGCDSFDDRTADTLVTIAVGAAGLAYEPKCVKVKTGTTLRFDGNFSFHPTEAACGPIAAVSRISGTTGSVDVTLNRVPEGVYGYYCTAHGTPAGAGMAGAFEVVP